MTSLEISTQLKQIRTDKKITQQELAEKIGASQQHIAKIETGIHNLRTETLIKLCDALGCKVEIITKNETI